MYVTQHVTIAFPLL